MVLVDYIGIFLQVARLSSPYCRYNYFTRIVILSTYLQYLLCGYTLNQLKTLIDICKC